MNKLLNKLCFQILFFTKLHYSQYPADSSGYRGVIHTPCVLYYVRWWWFAKYVIGNYYYYYYYYYC